VILSFKAFLYFLCVFVFFGQRTLAKSYSKYIGEIDYSSTATELELMPMLKLSKWKGMLESDKFISVLI